MKYQPTQEQRQAAETKRNAAKDLARKFSAMSTEERQEALRDVCIMTIGGRALSGHNTYMVLMGMRTATVVGGFKQWLDAGRAVRKGVHGLAIWVPTGRTYRDDAGNVYNEDGSFVIGTVFDISQTDAIAATGEVQEAAA